MREQWKVGELARLTGLSVRTLHHYDALGLLTPSQRSAAGYRLYNADDVVRLQQIKSLRQLGFSLSQIRTILDRPTLPLHVIDRHLHRLEAQIALQQRLAGRLRALAWKLARAEEISPLEFMQAIEVMTMTEQFEKYFTPEQMAEIQQRGRQVGEARIRQVEAEWAELIARMRDAMQSGADPGSAQVQALARQWQALIDEFTGGNPAVEASLREMYTNEPGAREFAGIDTELFAYVAKAMTAK